MMMILAITININVWLTKDSISEDLARGVFDKVRANYSESLGINLELRRFRTVEDIAPGPWGEFLVALYARRSVWDKFLHKKVGRKGRNTLNLIIAAPNFNDGENRNWGVARGVCAFGSHRIPTALVTAKAETAEDLDVELFTTLIEHEIGHTLGAQHLFDTESVMSPGVPSGAPWHDISMNQIWYCLGRRNAK